MLSCCIAAQRTAYHVSSAVPLRFRLWADSLGTEGQEDERSSGFVRAAMTLNLGANQGLVIRFA